MIRLGNGFDKESVVIVPFEMMWGSCEKVEN